MPALPTSIASETFGPGRMLEQTDSDIQSSAGAPDYNTSEYDLFNMNYQRPESVLHHYLGSYRPSSPGTSSAILVQDNPSYWPTQCIPIAHDSVWHPLSSRKMASTRNSLQCESYELNYGYSETSFDRVIPKQIVSIYPVPPPRYGEEYISKRERHSAWYGKSVEYQRPEQGCAMHYVLIKECKDCWPGCPEHREPQGRCNACRTWLKRSREFIG